MATVYTNFEGYAYWAKVYPDHYDEYMGDKRWSLFLIFKNEENLALFEASGLGLKLKENETGKGVQFRRPFAKMIKGEVVNFDPPRVTIWDDAAGRYVDFDQPIGNGSLVRANVAVYDTVKGKGHRLEGVTILKHIPYEVKEPSEEDAKSVKTSVSPKAERPW